MRTVPMVLEDESTWPKDLVTCLEKHRQTLLSWEQRHAGGTPRKVASAKEYDAAHNDLGDAVSSLSLIGYHCTRLTIFEIDAVRRLGMTPQNGRLLHKRIDKLVVDGDVSPEIAERLKTKNMADDKNRKGMIWFCFFPPHKEAQYGLERFFRSWGGEALYNGHERDPCTGPVLARIGTPCVIEAEVPVGNNRHTFLTTKIARHYLIRRGLKTNECVDHEGYSTSHIPPESVRRIFQHPGISFMEITGADKWVPPI